MGEAAITFSQKALQSLVQRALSEWPQVSLKGLPLIRQQEKSVKVNIPLSVSYGCSIPQIARQIQAGVEKEICRITHLHVQRVDIEVVELKISRARRGGEVR